ncbi:hypothetical protein DBR40_23265 [Pedobacter sp. KBW01]|uniref:glycosyltransferase family 2 protein n=1 Tax=Pedobacter sp. KBW01 TaxID=2153364 RepID=UPI000F59F17F|nr:glycosyltransferase [Pedobacter sp. KBW01]RQO65698.1 hypothetical protein DBR40_23265 [Pedobacter sp. KBW01]
MAKTKTLQVDILIITYNQENYIAEAIESALKQTYENCRVIVADDCSTDSTRQIIDRYQKLAPNKLIKVYNEKNVGITANCNAGFKAVTGDYFVIMGGDDVLYPNKVEEQLKWFGENSDKILCGHNLDLIDESSIHFGTYNTLSKKPGKGAFQWIELGMLQGCMSIMIKLDTKKEIAFDERLIYTSDLKFFIDFLGIEGKYGFSEEYLGAYRKTETSITASKWDACVRDAAMMYDILKIEGPASFQKFIKRGKGYVVDYGIALRNFNKKEYKRSFNEFIKIICKDVTFLKAYLRLAQVTVALLIGKK